MSKYKIGDEVEATTDLVVTHKRVSSGDRFIVIGHYETVGGFHGLVIEDERGVHLLAESHVKPVPPKPPVPAELWVNAYESNSYRTHTREIDADEQSSPSRIGGKAWRYVLADNQEESK